MENNVIISIQGKQSFEAQDDDTIELVTEGCLEPDGDDGYTLSYHGARLPYGDPPSSAAPPSLHPPGLPSASSSG